MMDLLHITSIRRGRDGGNRPTTNSANYDESKANPFPDLPDPLTLKNGQKVTNAEAWWQERRPEIVEDFDREIYGRVPKVTPKVNWEITGTTNGTNGDIPITSKTLIGHVDNSSYPDISVNIQLTLSTPANAKGPVPVIMQFGFGAFPFRRPGATNATGTNALARGFGPGFGGGPDWRQLVLSNGWGYAVIVPNSVQADNGAGLTQGIIGLVNKGQPRKADDWGALRAWAWGASRALDYLETDKSVNSKQVGLEGVSRYGKATLVAMAYEPRFAIAFVASSGEGGVKLHRRDWGEVVENLAGTGDYHWMAGNFIKYAGPLNWNDLPVDSHELVALCAPRPSSSAQVRRTATRGWTRRGVFLPLWAQGRSIACSARKTWVPPNFPPSKPRSLTATSVSVSTAAATPTAPTGRPS